MKSYFITSRLSFFMVCLLTILSCKEDIAINNYWDWRYYLGSPSTDQYSPLNLIHKDNLHQLSLAWTYNSGSEDPRGLSQIQCNPLVIEGVVYGSSPELHFFAVDGRTGEELWRYNPWPEGQSNQMGMGVNRGLTFWKKGNETILFASAGPYLLAIDPNTGNTVSNFGKAGRIDLREGLDREVSHLFLVNNSPGIIYNDKIIVGSRVSESTGHVPGHIRAFNVRTGKREWIFHTIPHPGEEGYETWPPQAYTYSGGANAWAGMSIDTITGIVYIPTGAPSFDFYGGDRLGENLYANCLIALNAETGEKIWHFQFTHHDLWDRDLPAPPVLCEVEIEGVLHKAVAQVTKSGYIFLFDRLTGNPLYEVEEVPVPTSTLEGENAWSTQPIPVGQVPFARNKIMESDLRTLDNNELLEIKEKWNNLAKNQLYIPPSEEGVLLFPGFDGGAEWGGPAVDKEGFLYVNTNEMPWILKMNKNNPDNAPSTMGQLPYNIYCRSCHGKDFTGNAIYAIPSLVDIEKRYNYSQVIDIMDQGRGNMPSFSHLSENQKDAIAKYIFKITDVSDTTIEDNWEYPYYFDGYKKFVDSKGYPVIKPPWGTLNAIDLKNGKLKWKIPLGEYPELAERGYPHTGTENYGGPIITASGLLIIAATLDGKLRIFDKEDGSLLWEYQLPAAGFATPATYQIGDKQYILIAAGGGKLGQPSGSEYLSFTID